MAAAESVVDRVKREISTGNATSSTVATLQGLFGTTSKTATATTGTGIHARAQKPTNAKAAALKTARSTKSAPRAPKKVAFVPVLEDECKALSAKERHALATDIVNATLKVLQNAARTNRALSSQHNEEGHGTPKHISPKDSKALHERSNNTSPAKASSTKLANDKCAASTVVRGESSSHETRPWTATAECARLAFAQLRAADREQQGTRSLPKYQVETGMLALISRMIALGLDCLAAKELCAVKKRLQSQHADAVAANKQSTKKAGAAKTPGHETLASLMQLDVDLESHPDIAPLAMTYWSYVLALLAKANKPAAIEDAMPHFELENQRSAVTRIVRYTASVGDNSKATKQLDALFQALMRLCPSISARADEIANDNTRCIRPESAFKINMIALSVRVRMTKLLAQPVDLAQNVLEPVSRVMSALLRRLPPGVISKSVLKICQKARASLGLSIEDTSANPGASFTISRTMSVLAERAGDAEEAHSYSKIAVQQCVTLEANHARRVAALSRQYTCALALPNTSDDGTGLAADCIEQIDKALQQSLSGSASDYEALLIELDHLFESFEGKNRYTSLASREELMRSAAAFASRYARLGAGKQNESIKNIIEKAIVISRQTESLLTWINKDTAQALGRTGLLQGVAERAAHTSLAQAWSGTRSAIMLSRILRGLVNKAIASVPEKSLGTLYDDTTLSSEQRGVVLEWQLQMTCEIAQKARARKSQAKVVRELVQKLLQVYLPTEFPVRRARVYAMAMRYQTVYPDTFQQGIPEDFVHAQVVDPEQPGRDGSLLPYLEDLRASLAISQSFDNNALDVDVLGQQIVVWHNILDKSHDMESLQRVIDSPSALSQQLSCLCDYFTMLGEHKSQLQLLLLLHRLHKFLDDKQQLCTTDSWLVRCYLLHGYAEAAFQYLDEATTLLPKVGQTSLAALDHHITTAQYFLCVDKLDESARALQSAAEVRSCLTMDSAHSQQRKVFRLHHVRGWLVQSQHLFALGNAHGALQAAKRSVQVANSIWAVIENSSSVPDKLRGERSSNNDTRPVDTLTRGVSKLNLMPTEDHLPQATLSPRSAGVSLWGLLPLMCHALMHLSNVYAHHGSFNEASYSSEQAVKISQEANAHGILSEVRCHRSLLLASAGKIEDAELLLAHEQESSKPLSPLTKINHLRAKVSLSTKLGDLEDALTFSREAETILKKIQEQDFLSSLQIRFKAGSLDPSDKSMLGLPGEPVPKPAARKRAGVVKKAATTSRETTARTRKTGEVSTQKETCAWGSCYVLQKAEARILLQSAILATRLGQHDAQSRIKWVADFCQIFPDTFDRRMLSYLGAMQAVETAIEADFTFNALAESTLALPALRLAERRSSAMLSTLQSGCGKATKPSKAVKSKKQAADSVLQLLLTARQCLEGSSSSMRSFTTCDTHKLYALLADTSMLLSATSGTQALEVLHPVREALHIEAPRIHAAECLSFAAKLESDITQASDLLLWPQSGNCQTSHELSATQFQGDYVDILPKSWTAVSLSLNEQCDELYVARYCSGQTPLLMRLPFSRQQSDDDDENLFDFLVGRAELQEIIELSNYSCHNSTDTSVKGAKTNWWSEREALDRRLQELLINIENIWLGGFRGLLSQHRRDDAQLLRFRQDFDVVLDRHLPSRKMKGSKKIDLDDQILELFVSLGADSQGELDMDEPLADLLYFVVDMLQFNGERNAYDEVDFDSMTVEVADALRSYYDAAEQQNDGAHLVLVLDRRLQAFPWESMPCLEKASVSRVDSMLTLRERLVAMRANAHKLGGEGRYTVSKHSGAYILNPSGDLKSTQAVLAPELGKLTSANGELWTSIVTREPSEEVFKAALQTASNLLYFGHGAGSQYIRPRAIRKLETCSEVVWLMGCSSGAVTEYDELEPFSVPSAYLQAGQVESEHPSKCMAVLATLWDVTDRDIDRFSLAVGEEWGLWQAGGETVKAPAKTPRKRTLAVPSTPEKCAKTPKTPKVHKTPAPSRTPARNRSRVRFEERKQQSLVEAVSKSRDACFLRYLNGAAPVVYGVPVYLGD
ncbi:Separin [Cercospora zeina]